MPRARHSLCERSRHPLEVPPGPASQESYDLIPALLALQPGFLMRQNKPGPGLLKWEMEQLARRVYPACQL